jgi:dolichol-phosphate mannosyltransferase
MTTGASTSGEERSSTLVSVVLPFLNEEACLPEFCSAIDSLAKEAPYQLELVFVDDGSTDDSVRIVENFVFQHAASVRLVKLTKNYGGQAAIRAGFANADGDLVTSLGVDLEEPPQMITTLFEEACKGYDVVYVSKLEMQVSRGSRAFSKAFAALIRRYGVKEYTSEGINNVMFSRKVADYLNSNVEANSSFQLQLLDSGFKHTTISMDYGKRASGTSKWTLSKKIKLFIDSFVSFSYMPIRAVSITGILLALAGILAGVVVIVLRLVNPNPVLGYTTIVAVLLFGFGVTNISLGIIAEYLWRTYDAARGRPAYIIDDVRLLSCSTR